MDKDFKNFIGFLNNKRNKNDNETNEIMMNDFKFISTQRLLGLSNDILSIKGNKLIEYIKELKINFKQTIETHKNKPIAILEKSANLIFIIEISVCCLLLDDIIQYSKNNKNKTFKQCLNHFENICEENNKKRKLDEDEEEEDEEYCDEEDYENEFVREVFKNSNKEDSDIIDEFYNNLSENEKVSVLSKIKEINNYLNEDKPIVFKIMELPLPISQKNYILKQYNLINSSNHPETKLQNWFSSLMSVPFNKYLGIDLNDKKNINKFLEDLSNKMDNAVYGHNDAKHSIIQIMAQQIRNPNAKGNVIGLWGCPGNGKTSLIKEGISKALGKPFVFISLGGASDASFLEGHSYTYEGSIYGRIVSALISSKCMNPVLYFDELDKVSKCPRGEEITNLLIHLTDPIQNSHFQDKYFHGIDIDISRATIIFSFNDPDNVNPILLDRITMIETKYLLTNQKVHIGMNYLLPIILEEVGLNRTDIIINEDIINLLINKYTYEGGVRKLKSLLYLIVREINLANLTKTRIDNKLVKFPYKVTMDNVKLFLKDKNEADYVKVNKESKCGVMNGLYANSLGIGGIMPIQVVFYPSTEPLTVKATGHLEQVIKESTEVACSLAWNNLSEEIQTKYLNEWKDRPMGIHIHCPEGAIPKDGPSAGAALTLAIYSLLMNKKIRNDIAMTGEINLEGNITEIGGLEQKLEAAKKAGVKLAMIPKQNMKDLRKINERNDKLIDNTFKIIAVETFNDILPQAFV